LGTIASDTFTDTSGTTLASHTLTTGGVWTLHASYSGSLAISSSNRCRVGAASAATSLYYPASGTPASADYTVTCDLVCITASATLFGPAVRVNTAANTAYSLRYSIGSTQWELVKSVAGSTSTLATYVETFNSGTKAIILDVSGSATVALRVTIDGTLRISYDDTAGDRITAAGKAGMRNATASAGADASGYHIDNWVWSEVDAGQPRVIRGRGVPGMAQRGTFGAGW
jgi:hypothetical protein